MRQLRIEGWMHHVSRHAVACFLTRGDLWISWEDGLKVIQQICIAINTSWCYVKYRYKAKLYYFMSEPSVIHYPNKLRETFDRH